MTQHTKKTANTHTQVKSSSAASKMSEPAVKLIDPARKLQEKTLEMGRKNVEKMKEAAEGISRVAAECTDVCSGNVDALVEVGAITSHNLQKVGTEMKETNNRFIQEFTDLMKQTIACRTIHDIVELQNKTVQQMSDNYFDITNKLCGLFFDSCSEAIDPLNERSVVASKQIRKAIAA